MNKTLLHVLWLSFVAVLVYACASQAELTGGAKDETPPKPLTTVPKDSTMNWTGNEINISFDEYVQLVSPKTNIFISPPLVVSPEAKASGKNVKVKLEGLMANTTYVLHFGDAIVDVNERNALEDHKLYFSTGSSIDSLSLQGLVVNAKSKEPAQKYLVALHSEDSSAKPIDSLLRNNSPAHIAFTDDKGMFTLDALPMGDFKVFTWNDVNGNLKWEETEEIGFYHQKVSTGVDSAVTLRAFKVPTEKAAIDYEVNDQNVVNITFSQPVVDIQYKVLSEFETWVGTSPYRDSLTVYANAEDTVLTIQLKLNDQKTDTLSITIPVLKDEKAKEQLSYKVAPGSIDDTFKLRFGYPVVSVNEEGIRLLSEKDSSTQLIKNPKISGRTNRTLEFYVPRGNGKKWWLILDSAAVEVAGGRVNEEMKVGVEPFETYSMGFKIADSTKAHYLVELITKDDKTLRFIQTTGQEEFVFTKLKPGKYKLKIIQDVNANGIWDPGNVTKGIQPESIWKTEEYELLEGWSASLITIDLSTLGQ